MCYAYLSDVPSPPVCSSDQSETRPVEEWVKKFSASRWFTRGWTLQEMIAPRRLTFFSKNWDYVGTKMDLAPILYDITEIPQDTLIYGDAFGESVSRRMSWAAKRQTTRTEDRAYCLLGIFNINMPLLYGEGERAFQRLQEEIVKITDDDTIFAWKAETLRLRPLNSSTAETLFQLRESPIRRATSSQTRACRSSSRYLKRKHVEKGWRSNTEFIAALKCRRTKGSHMNLATAPIGIYVKKIFGNEYVRVDANQLHSISHFRDVSDALGWSPVTVQQRMDYSPWYCFNKMLRGYWCLDQEHVTGRDVARGASKDTVG